METVVDLFGEACEVLDRCERCGAPRYRRAGEAGWTQLHAKGCHLNQGAWHVEARAAQDESGMRDLAQVEERVRAWGKNERPIDAPVTQRAPRRIGH